MIGVGPGDPAECPNDHGRDDNGSETMGKMNDDFTRSKRRNDVPKRQREIRNRQTRVRMAHQRAKDQRPPWKRGRTLRSPAKNEVRREDSASEDECVGTRPHQAGKRKREPSSAGFGR